MHEAYTIARVKAGPRFGRRHAVNAIRIAFGVLVTAVLAGAGWGQQGAAPGPLPGKPPATEADQAPPEADVTPEVRPMRIRVSANVAASQLRDFVEPEYPAGTKAQGKVVLHVVIDYDGTVMKAEGVSGDADLTKAAVDAVKQWQYRPTKINGVPVEVDTTVNVVFALDKKGRLKPQPRNR